MKNYTSEENTLKFKDLKRKVQKKIRKKYKNYVEDFIDHKLDKGNRKLRSLAKHIKKDSSSVEPLKVDDNLITNTKDKSNVQTIQISLQLKNIQLFT